jgi:ABC-type transport system involved in multi-copper enzyme maturation permease subunit
MISPIVHQELLLGSRRNRLHILRWLYGGWLVVQVCWFWVLFQSEQRMRQVQQQAFGGPEIVQYLSAPEVVGRRFTETYITQQLMLLLLVTPAFVAGAITDEKRRGTLQYLMTTDLESRHIVLGKLLGRVAQVALLTITGFPLFFYLAGFAGASPIALAIALVVLIVPLLALGSATVLASVWCRQTRDAVLGLYTLGLLVFSGVWWAGGTLHYLDPLWVMEPAWGNVRYLDWAELGQRLALSTLLWGLFGGVCLTMAIWRLRPVFVRELESSRPQVPRWLAGPRKPVDENRPVFWRERHVDGLAPVPALRRVPAWAATLLIFALSAALGASIYSAGPSGLGQGADDFQAAGYFALLGILVMLLASLVVGIRCSGAITGERERQTWDSLLLTPITARELVRGKLWGVMGASYRYLAAFAVPALASALLIGPLSLLVVVFSLGVTILAMYFVGAAGIWCSVKSKNSWRSLLATLGLGYLAGGTVYLLSTPLLFIIAFLLITFLQFLDMHMQTRYFAPLYQNFGVTYQLFFIASCIGLAAIFLLMSRLFLAWAQRYIADRERTRHWHDEPVYRRRKRVAVVR